MLLYVLDILSESAAGHMLMVLVHSLLLMKIEHILPCLTDICHLLPVLDKLTEMSSAAEVLDKQEVAWPKHGKYIVTHCSG